MKILNSCNLLFILSIITIAGYDNLCYAQNDENLKGWMLGQELEEIYHQGNKKAFNDMFDMEYIYDKVLESSEEEFIVDFNEGVKKAGVTHGLWNEILYQIQNGAYYNFVSYKTFDNHIEVLFRLFSQSGLNYHNYIFHKVSGKYLIRDVYLYITGEYITESLATAFRNILLSMNGELDNQEIDLPTMTRLKEVNELLQEGKNEEAKLLLDEEIDKKYQDHRKVLIYKLRAMDDVTSEDYLNLVDKISSMTEAKSTLFLLGIDRYFLLGQFTDALRMIDSLGVMTEDDILDHHRGNIYLAQGKIDEAVDCYRRLKKNFPYLPESYDNLIDLYYQLMEYENAFDILKEAHENIQISKKDLNDIIVQDYPILYDQAYYQKWLKSNTSDFEVMATSITYALSHSWNLNEITDPEGNSMKVPSGIDQWIFNTDYSCMIRHGDEEKTGMWEYDLTTDELVVYVIIDETSEEGKKMIEQGNFFNDDAGNKFTQKEMDVSVIYGNRMSLKDEHGNIFTFIKSLLADNPEKFEGKVVYNNVVTDKTRNYTSEEIEKVVGAYYTNYFKGNKTRSETSGLFKGIQLYTGGDTIYSFEENKDTVYYELVSQKQEEVIDWEILEVGPKLLGFNTRRFFYKTLTESNVICYTDALMVDKPVGQMPSGSWNFFFKKTASVGLKTYSDDPETTREAVASKLIAIELPEYLFKVPEGVRVPLE